MGQGAGISQLAARFKAARGGRRAFEIRGSDFEEEIALSLVSYFSFTSKGPFEYSASTQSSPRRTSEAQNTILRERTASSFNHFSQRMRIMEPAPCSWCPRHRGFLILSDTSYTLPESLFLDAHGTSSVNPASYRTKVPVH